MRKHVRPYIQQENRAVYNSSTSLASNQLLGCRVRFVSDLVGNPEDSLSRDAALNISRY